MSYTAVLGIAYLKEVLNVIWCSNCILQPLLENFLVLPFAFIDLVVYQLFLALTNFTFRSNDHSRPIFMMPSLIWA